MSSLHLKEYECLREYECNNTKDTVIELIEEYNKCHESRIKLYPCIMYKERVSNLLSLYNKNCLVKRTNKDTSDIIDKMKSMKL